MSELLGLIDALAGTAIGGFVTYKVESKKQSFERASEKEHRFITASESIHTLLSEISSQSSLLNMGIIGDLDYNIPLKADILEGEKIQLDRLKMLVDFYVQPLGADVEKITDQFAIISTAVAEVLLKKNQNYEWKTKTIRSASCASAEITKLAQAAQEKLGQKVQEFLTHGRLDMARPQ